MGRAEAFAMQNGTTSSAADAIGTAGYAIVLLVVGFFREFFGSGKLLGISIFPLVSEGAGTGQRPDGARTGRLLPDRHLHLSCACRPALVTPDFKESIMEELLSLFVKAVFVENMALAFFLHVLIPCRLEEG